MQAQFSSALQGLQGQFWHFFPGAHSHLSLWHPNPGQSFGSAAKTASEPKNPDIKTAATLAKQTNFFILISLKMTSTEAEMRFSSVLVSYSHVRICATSAQNAKSSRAQNIFLSFNSAPDDRP
jgi:hypothetical protein